MIILGDFCSAWQALLDSKPDAVRALVSPETFDDVLRQGLFRSFYCGEDGRGPRTGAVAASGIRRRGSLYVYERELMKGRQEVLYFATEKDIDDFCDLVKECAAKDCPFEEMLEIWKAKPSVEEKSL